MVTESCTKYDDGPLISLRSAKERVTGTWEVESLTADGNDSTQALKGQPCYAKIVLIDFGTWSMATYPECGTIGSWQFDKNCKHIYIVAEHFANSSIRLVGPFLNANQINWNIKRLSNKQLWIETDYENIHWQVHLNKD